MHSKKILRTILNSQRYLCLSTVDIHAKPWSSPVAYVCDEDFTLYFISYIGSLHAKNIAQNKEVALSVYDSSQPLRHAFGIQAAGHAEIVDEWRVPKKIQKKLFDMVALAVLAKEYSFYRINLTDIYLPDAERWKEFHHLRTKIEL